MTLSGRRRPTTRDGTTVTKQIFPVGLSPDEIVERESGSYLSTALILAELGGTVEMAEAEFQYYEELEAVDLVRLCRELRAHLDRISLSRDGHLTLNRECRRCSGAGQTRGEDPCIECDGRGYIHADEAERADAR
jgi:hypothetical protein